MSKEIDSYLYQEVFVTGVDHVTASSGELNVHKSFENLVNYLSTKSVGLNSDIRALHGVITSAKAIPNDFCGRSAFILIIDPESDGQGLLLDSSAEDNCEELAEEIETLLSSEEIASNFVEIDNVYILYGYEMTVSLTVDEDDLNEDIIAACAKVNIKAKELAKSIEED